MKAIPSSASQSQHGGLLTRVDCFRVADDPLEAVATHYRVYGDRFLRGWGIGVARPAKLKARLGRVPEFLTKDFGQTTLDAELTEMVIQMFVHQDGPFHWG